MIKAIMIDPYEQTIEVVDYSGDWKDIGGLLGCELFTSVYIDHMDTMFIDDEGIYVENQRYFKIGDMPTPLAGKALVLGTDDEGDSTDCVSTVKDIQDMVEWCPEGLTVEPRFEVFAMEEDLDVDMLSDRELVDLIFGERVIH